jgi:predicted O-methyltransferase YrrM
MEHIIDKTINGTGDSDAHLMSLYGMCIGIKSKNILELGVRNGVTTLPLLMAAKETNGKVISVDINPTNFEPPDDLVEYWEFVQMDALEYLKKIDKTNVLDFVYVDDWHSYEHVKSELEELDKCVSPKSLIILHDLMYGNWSPHYHTDLTMDDGQWANGGPYRAVAELNKQFWEFATIPVCNGLTILRKKYSNKYHY